MSGIKMKNDFPKITVVTITFNAEKFLEAEQIDNVVEANIPGYVI